MRQMPVATAAAEGSRSRLRSTLSAFAVPMLVAALATTTVSCSSGQQARPYVDIRTSSAADGWQGAGLDDPYRLPFGQFTDTDDAPVSWPDDPLPWPVTVVLFAYTNCPDVCSTQLADITAARRGLPEDLRQRIGVVMITTDPARDDAATIRRYLDRFDPSFVGLRADEATLAAVAESLGVAFTGIEPAPEGADAAGGYEVGHGAQLIGFGPDGLARVLWLPGTPVGAIRADLERLAAS